MQKILFVCIHNSARNQMAEALLNRLGAAQFEAQSAGIEPAALNPLVVAALAKIGIDISAKAPRSVADVIQSGAKFDYVITVCDEASAERCSTFPAETNRLHWGFPDPGQFQGSWEEKLEQTCAVRRAIEAKLKHFLQSTFR
jgi:arsenate reductase